MRLSRPPPVLLALLGTTLAPVLSIALALPTSNDPPSALVPRVVHCANAPGTVAGT